ncbi:MAG: radical SAM protein [Treponema sp.]|jgi:pyruvate formate lyase activating enzyme|nr:radical SAM protein [Treponema sp.]
MIRDEQLTEPAGVMVKTTLVDYPGRVATAFFLKGCNLRCPYCYNRGLVLGGEAAKSDPQVSAAALLEHLAARKNVLSGLVLSGGEPLLNPLTPYLISQARAMGYKIKLDTNGTLPDELQKLLADDTLRPDFIAMDIKTAPERYDGLVAPVSHKLQSGMPDEPSKLLYSVNGGAHHVYKVCTDDFSAPEETTAEKLIRSAKLISTYPAANREFRTVLVPGLVAESDLAAIAALLPEDASWQLAQFRNENCLDPSFNDRVPYFDDRIKELVTCAHRLIPGAALR